MQNRIHKVSQKDSLSISP